MAETKTITRKAEIVRRVNISLAHREIGKGIAAYRLHQKIDGHSQKREGLARIEDLDKLVSGDLELRDLGVHPIFKRGEWDSSLIAVKPEFLEWARKFGFGANREDTKDEGLYDEKRWNLTPLTHLDKGKPVHFIEFFSAAHQLFDMEGVPVPVCLGFDYISGGMSNECFKLKKVVKILSERDDIHLVPHGGERARSWGEDTGEFIGAIPGYNADKGRDRCVMFRWRPGDEDYQKMWARAVEICQKARATKNGPSSDDLRTAAMALLGLAPAMKKEGRYRYLGEQRP